MRKPGNPGNPGMTESRVWWITEGDMFDNLKNRIMEKARTI